MQDLPKRSSGDANREIWETINALHDVCLLTPAEIEDLDFMAELRRLLGEERGVALIGASKLAHVFLAQLPTAGRVS